MILFYLSEELSLAINQNIIKAIPKKDFVINSNWKIFPFFQGSNAQFIPVSASL